MRFLTCLLGSSLLGVAAAKQAANFNVSEETARRYDCGAQCQKILQRTNKIDIDGMGYDFDFDFYATAANFSDSKPGDVLKFQRLDPSLLQIKAGTSVYRMQYTSLTSNNTTVPVTGFIALPYAAGLAALGESDQTNPEQVRFPVVAFAHGTCGLFRGCAPSNGASLWDYDSWQLLVQRGYAVVATDYAGLGNNYTTHKYGDSPAQVNDVFYSMMAARKLFGAALTESWVSVGHSQGGTVAWKLAESNFVNCHDGHRCQNGTSRNNYLGTVTLAPGTLYQLQPSNTTEGSFAGYLPHVALALQRLLPNTNVDILGPKLQKRLRLAEEAQLCTTGMMGLTLDLSPKELLSMDGLKRIAPEVLKMTKGKSPATGGRSYAPILLVQGLNDTSVAPHSTEKAYRASCGYGNEVHLSQYPGLEHSPLLPASAAEWLAWIDERFSGHRTSGQCSKTVVRPYDMDFKAPPELNFTAITA